MATRIKFRLKDFSKVGKVWKGVKENATVPITATSLVVSSANLATNRSRHDKDREYQDKQLEAMNKLTDRLGKFNESIAKMDNSLRREEPKKEGAITKFRKKILNKN